MPQTVSRIEVSEVQYAIERARIRQQLALNAFQYRQDLQDDQLRPEFSIEDYGSDVYLTSYGYCLDAAV